MVKKYRPIALIFLCFIALACYRRISPPPSVLRLPLPPANQLADSCYPDFHVGYMLVDAFAGTTIIAHNEKKYFTPASTTKLFTTSASLYALKDSVVRFSYTIKKDTLFIRPYGDPTWFHPQFDSAFSFFDSLRGRFPDLKYYRIYLPKYKVKPYADGWSFEDFNEIFFKPISIFCIDGNEATIQITDNKYVLPKIFSNYPIQSFSSQTSPLGDNFFLYRSPFSNQLYQRIDTSVKYNKKTFPIYACDKDMVYLLSQKTQLPFDIIYDNNENWLNNMEEKKVVSPLDTLHRKMLVNSDNFLADQMALQSGLMLGKGWVIDSLHSHLSKTLWKDMPQKMYWWEGSGLSRYNSNTPQNLIFILQKLIQQKKSILNLARLLPTIGEGTFKNWNIPLLKDKLFVKSGSFKGVYCMAGILHTRKNNYLLLAIMINSNSDLQLDGLKNTLLQWYEHY